MSVRRIERGKGHSYEIDGKPADGVTTVINEGMGTPFAIGSGWAARVCASYAIDQWEVLNLASPSERLEMIRGAPSRESDEAARRGTDIHRYAELTVSGDAVDVPDVLFPYVRSCVQWFDDFKVSPVIAEKACFSYRWNYGGTFDLIADIPGKGRYLVDFKSGKNVYADKTAMQLAAYRYAEVLLDEAGNEVPMLEVDGTLVVHVKSDAYEALPIVTSLGVHRAFLYVQQTARYRQHAYQLLERPIDPPALESA